MPIIGFIIGYFTNYLAIKMLFYPKKPIFGFQGVLPKRKNILAKKIAESAMHILPESVKKLTQTPFIGKAIEKTIQESIEKQIQSLSIDELETLILKIVKKELRFITWTGGILGLLIGIIQSLILII